MVDIPDITIVFMGFIYKPTNTTGGHHIVDPETLTPGGNSWQEVTLPQSQVSQCPWDWRKVGRWKKQRGTNRTVKYCYNMIYDYKIL